MMTGDPRTVPAALDRLARQFPDHAALITDDRSFTAAELRDEVHRATAALITLGVQPRDRVAIWSPNTWHWVIACLAIHHAGAAMVPLNTRYTASEAADAGQDVGGFRRGVAGVQRHHGGTGVVDRQDGHHPVPGVR